MAIGKAAAVQEMPSPIYEAVKIGEDDFTDEIDDLLNTIKIDPNNLTEEASLHPSVFARFALLAEEASASARTTKRSLDIAIANLDKDLRAQFESSHEKATDTRVAKEIEADDSIQQLRDDLLEAERCAGILGALRQSLVHKREMIAELMRDARHEWQAVSGD